MSVIPAVARQWDGLIVLCAANNYDGVRMGDWHLAAHLSKLAPVLYVDPPMSRLTPARSPATAGALRSPRLRLQGPGLARLCSLSRPGAA